MSEKAIEKHCPKCGSDMIDAESGNVGEPRYYYCMCCGKGNFGSTSCFYSKKYFKHKHSESCKYYTPIPTAKVRKRTRLGGR